MSIDVYLLEEQSHQITFLSNLKQRSLPYPLLKSVAPTTIRCVAIWDQCLAVHCVQWNFSRGDWNRENGHRETIKIVGTDIARLDNARPHRKGGHRETWQHGTRQQGWTSQDWTTWDQIARVDIARPDNVAPDQTEVYNFYAAWNIRPIMNFIYQFVLIFFVICAYYVRLSVLLCFLPKQNILCMKYYWTEAFGPTKHLLIDCRLTYLISWRSWFSFELSTSTCASTRHQSRLRFLPAAAAADSPVTERRSGRPHHFRTAVRLFQADFVGVLDNFLRTVEPTPGYAIVLG